jgi:hypothetical protein
MDLVGVAAQERPEIAEPLRALAVGYENRTFLPQLRDVQRFLDRTAPAYRTANSNHEPLQRPSSSAHSPTSHQTT